MRPISIPLPNGEFARFRSWNEPGPNHEAECTIIRKISPWKRYSDKLMGTAGEKVAVIFADFDEKTKKGMSNVEIERLLKASPFTVVRSFSGAPKGVITVLWDRKTNGPLPREVQLKTLRHYLPKPLRSRFDRSGSAMTTTKIGSQTIDGLMHLQNKRPLRPMIPKTWKPYTNWSWGFMDLELRAMKEGIFKKTLDVLACLRGLDVGFNVSQGRLGATLGVSQRYAGTILKELEKRHYIDILDRSYIMGKRAYTYRAKGLLLNEIKLRRGGFQPPSQKQKNQTPLFKKRCYRRITGFLHPTMVPGPQDLTMEGTSHSIMLAMSRLAPSREALKDWFQASQGKDREAVAYDFGHILAGYLPPGARGLAPKHPFQKMPYVAPMEQPRPSIPDESISRALPPPPPYQDTLADARPLPGHPGAPDREALKSVFIARACLRRAVKDAPPGCARRAFERARASMGRLDLNT